VGLGDQGYAQSAFGRETLYPFYRWLCGH